MQLDPIDQLICDCLGNSPDEGLASRLAELSPSDWKSFIDRANEHAVSPLCYKRLKEPALSGNVPARILEDLKKIYLLNGRNNILYYHNLTAILAGFQHDGIPVILLKGAYLAEYVYKNIALRIIGDVDILIHQQDVAKASKNIIKLGYATRDFWFEAEQETSHELPPFSKSNSPDLDIHWGMEVPFSTFTINLTQLWERAKAIKINGIQTLTLDQEDTILHLCLHASYHHHFTNGLRSLCDIDQSLREFKDSLDWNIIVQRSIEWKMEKCTFLCLFLVRKLFHTHIPHQVMDSLTPPDFNESMVDLALKQVFPSSDLSVPTSEYLVRFLSTQNIKEKLQFWFQRAFISRKMLSRKYSVDPESLMVYLYYPVRIIDLFVLYGRTVWHLLIKDSKTKDFVQKEADGNHLADWLSKPNL